MRAQWTSASALGRTYDASGVLKSYLKRSWPIGLAFTGLISLIWNGVGLATRPCEWSTLLRRPSASVRATSSTSPIVERGQRGMSPQSLEIATPGLATNGLPSPSAQLAPGSVAIAQDDQIGRAVDSDTGGTPRMAATNDHNARRGVGGNSNLRARMDRRSRRSSTLWVLECDPRQSRRAAKEWSRGVHSGSNRCTA